jgi:hypothetical protein
MTYPVFASGDVLNASDMNGVGLWLIGSVQIGSGVTSVVVNAAFSNEYDNFRIIVSGGVASATTPLYMTLGSTTGGYYYGGEFRTYMNVAGSISGSSVGSWYAGEGSTNSLVGCIDIFSPVLAKPTTMTSSFAPARTDAYWLSMGGFLNNSTQYTGFTFTTAGGATLTGGTIAIYGYRRP